jgi:DNA replication protein
LLTPMLAEELKEAEKEYPAEWIADAFRIAVKQNKRSWAYINGILKRMKTEGRGEDSKRKHWWDDEYDKYVNR